MRRARISKLTVKEVERLKVEHKRHILVCKTCHTRELEVDDDVIEVECARCASHKAPPPEKFLKSDEELQKEADNGYPKGWRFMSQFIHRDGTVYFRGREQQELKGTLDQTDVDAIRKERKKKKKSIREKNEDELKQTRKLAEIHKQAKREQKANKISENI